MTTARIITEKRISLPGIEPTEPGAVFAAVLPWGPTTNHYWAHFLIAGKPRIGLSAVGKTYRAAVVNAVGRVKRLTGPLCFAAVFRPPTLARLDLDNRLKPLLDALTAAAVWEDDSQVKQIRAAFGPVERGGGSVRVLIVPLADAPACDLLTRAAERRDCR